MEKIKWLLSVLFGLITAFAQQRGVMIVLVAVAIVFDYATGMIKANIEGNVSSEIGIKGFYKKMALLVCLFFGFFLDYFIPYMCTSLMIDLKYDTPFGAIICCYIVLNECISVCENLYACNPRIIPNWIVNVLKKAQAQLEDGGNDDDVKTE